MIIDPNSSGGVGKGRKVFHGVGLRRWESSTGTPILDIGLVVLKDMEGEATRTGSAARGSSSRPTRAGAWATSPRRAVTASPATPSTTTPSPSSWRRVR